MTKDELFNLVEPIDSLEDCMMIAYRAGEKSVNDSLLAALREVVASRDDYKTALPKIREIASVELRMYEREQLWNRVEDADAAARKLVKELEG